MFLDNVILLGIWFLALVYLLKHVVVGVIALARRSWFEVPFGESFVAYLLDDSPMSAHENVSHLTSEIEALGFHPQRDILDRDGKHYARAFLNDEGLLCLATPQEAPGNPNDDPSFVLTSRFPNGEVLHTTNVPRHSAWMDCVPWRRTQIIDSHLPLLEVYGSHMVRVHKEEERGNHPLPYQPETFLDDVRGENDRVFEYLVGRGYYTRDEERRRYVPTLRFALAFARGHSWPGIWGVVSFVAALVVFVVGGVYLFMEPFAP